MILWIVMAALAAAAALAVLFPLYRARPPSAAPNAPALSIYRDQLGEVERDLGRGLIAASEAGAARTEIARRLLKADAAGSVDLPRSGERARQFAAVALVAMPVAALGLYLFIGSPDLPDQPFTARMTAPLEDQDVATLVVRAEARLAANPNDGSGWEVIGPAYVRLGRYRDGVRAFGNALQLLGSDVRRETSYGDAIVRLNDGVVTADARAAFERANRLDPKAVPPRFYLALALGQEGRKAEAVAAWQALLAGAPADAGWVPIARNALARVESAEVAAPAAAAGPSEADIKMAAQMSPQERLGMIGGMVEQLARRLAGDPSDGAGWARLIRSYMVLGRDADARAALAKARSALAGSDKLAAVESEALAAGLKE
jgi:cytochrome c-type biogenesis protein CcmH